MTLFLPEKLCTLREDAVLVFCSSAMGGKGMGTFRMTKIPMFTSFVSHELLWFHSDAFDIAVMGSCRACSTVAVAMLSLLEKQ